MFCFVWFGLISGDRISLCTPGSLRTRSVDQASLKLRDPPASASQVLGLKVCATMPGFYRKGFWFFQDRVSLYSPGCPGTHSVDQASLKLRNLPASASQSAGITGVCPHRPVSEQSFCAHLNKSCSGQTFKPPHCSFPSTPTLPLQAKCSILPVKELFRGEVPNFKPKNQLSFQFFKRTTD